MELVKKVHPTVCMHQTHKGDHHPPPAHITNRAQMQLQNPYAQTASTSQNWCKRESHIYFQPLPIWLHFLLLFLILRLLHSEWWNTCLRSAALTTHWMTLACIVYYGGYNSAILTPSRKAYLSAEECQGWYYRDNMENIICFQVNNQEISL